MKEKLSKGVILSLASGDVYCKQFQLSALPQREVEEGRVRGGWIEREEGEVGCCTFIFPLLRVPVYLYTALLIFPASFDGFLHSLFL